LYAWLDFIQASVVCLPSAFLKEEFIALFFFYEIKKRALLALLISYGKSH
jgi:hypothetical protein